MNVDTAPLPEAAPQQMPAPDGPLSRARPKMFKSDTLTADQIDYLYSELTCLEW